MDMTWDQNYRFDYIRGYKELSGPESTLETQMSLT